MTMKLRKNNNALGLLAILAGWVMAGCVVIPPPIESHYNRGVELYDQGKYADAVEEYKLALRENPDDTFAKYNLAVVYQDQGKLDKAGALYREVLETTEDTNSRINLAAIHYTRSDIDSAIKELKTALDANRDNPNPASFLGEYLTRQERLDEAEHYFLEALKIDDQHAPTYYRLGSLDLKQGREEKGLERLEKSVDLAPEDPVFLEALGDEYERIDKVFEAINMFERLSVLEPDREDLYVRLGDLYKKRNLHKEAVARYWTALSINQDAPFVRQKLLDIYGIMSQEELAELKKLEQQNSLAQTP